LLLEHMENGKSLPEALAVAREAGVVETDPSLDVEGWDAAAKCVIVARSLFAGSLTLEQVDRRGIENLTTAEVQAAATAGTPIKLLCRINNSAAGVRASVQPTRLQSSDPLSTLRNGALGIVYDAEPIGPMFLAAYGSGGTSTAAAVIRDVLNLR
jgi:homoserine dehydrogenase